MIGGADLKGGLMKYLPPNRRGTRLAAGLALTAAASLTFAACGGGSSGSAGGEASGASGGGGEKIAVTLITKTDTNPFFIAMKQGAVAAGQKNGVSITSAAGKA